jgi:hypothetical protein
MRDDRIYHALTRGAQDHQEFNAVSQGSPLTVLSESRRRSLAFEKRRCLFLLITIPKIFITDSNCSPKSYNLIAHSPEPENASVLDLQLFFVKLLSKIACQDPDSPKNPATISLPALSEQKKSAISYMPLAKIELEDQSNAQARAIIRACFHFTRRT